MKNKFWKKALLFFVGFCIYISIEVLFRTIVHGGNGYSNWLMGVVGGLCLMILDDINNKISWDVPLVTQMLIGMFEVTGLELLSGLLSKYVLKVVIWDYSGLPGNLFGGIVHPLFCFFWFLLAGVGIILADIINYYVLHEDPRPYYRHLNKKIWFTLPKRECD